MNSSTIESHAPRTELNTRSWWAALVKSIRRQLAWIRHQRQIRRDVLRLMEYDDRTLADIGLSRGEVEYTVRFGRLYRCRQTNDARRSPTSTSIRNKQQAADLWRKGVTKFADCKTRNS